MADVIRRCARKTVLTQVVSTCNPLGDRRRALLFVPVACLAIFIQGCVTEATRQSSLDPSALAVSVELRRVITGIGYKGVLFTPLDAEGAELLGWTPSAYDIARMEARVPELLERAGPRLFAEGLPDLSRYRRQYSGHLANDRRILQANYIDFTLIQERNLDWEHSRIPVYDAGARYFQVWFDMESERIVQLLPTR